MKFFGPPKFRKAHETQIEPPVHLRCVHCDEPIAAGDIGTVNLAGQATHHECEIRAVIGSVGHQERRCSCYGGTEEDPPGLTRRQAARAAANLFYLNALIT